MQSTPGLSALDAAGRLPALSAISSVLAARCLHDPPQKSVAILARLRSRLRSLYLCGNRGMETGNARLFKPVPAAGSTASHFVITNGHRVTAS